ncbi:hypothetical protein GQ42DRAFT_161584 [Ramicandelaber brevisporus]|nr:hypothetical protein GQ42DRAFT_161584 [Ramicandelaber brevisporus]
MQRKRQRQRQRQTQQKQQAQQRQPAVELPKTPRWPLRRFGRPCAVHAGDLPCRVAFSGEPSGHVLA